MSFIIKTAREHVLHHKGEYLNEINVFSWSEPSPTDPRDPHSQTPRFSRQPLKSTFEEMPQFMAYVKCRHYPGRKLRGRSSSMDILINLVI